MPKRSRRSRAPALRRKRRRRTAKRRYRSYVGMGKGPKLPVIAVKRRFFAGRVFATTTTTAHFYSILSASLDSAGTLFNTTLAGLPELGDYQDMFETYKLCAIKYEFKPRLASATLDQVPPSAAGTFADLGYITYGIDRWDKSTAVTAAYGSTAYNSFLEKVYNTRTVRSDKPFSIYIKPTVAEQYGGGAVRYVKPTYTVLSLASGTSMVHGSVQMIGHTQNFSTAANVRWPDYDVYATYYLKFRGMA